MALFPAPGKSDSRSRLIVLIAALALVGASMHSCHKKSRQHMSAPIAEQTMITANPAISTADPLPDLYPNKTLQRKNILDFVFEDDKRVYEASKLENIRPALESAFSWLKSQSHEEMRQQAWARGRWSYTKVMRDIDRWRLQTLHVYGTLISKDISELQGVSKSLEKLHKLILFDTRNHQAFTVLTPLMPKSARPVKGRDDGSFLACDGLFLMRYPYMAEGGLRRTPLFLAKRVYLTREALSVPTRLDERGDPGSTYTEMKPNETVRQIDMPFLNKTMYAPPKDGTGHRFGTEDFRVTAANIREDKPALDHLFEYVYAFSDKELHNTVNPELSYVSLMRGNQPPKWMTGKVASFNGIAGTVQTYHFKDDPLGINRIHLLIGHDMKLGGPQFTWTLATLNLPKDLHEDDIIEAEGVFAKLYPYRTPENKWHWSPLLVCRSVRRIPPTPPQAVTPMHIGIGIAALIMLIVMYWSSKRDSKRLAALRQRTLERRIVFDKKRAEQKKLKQAATTETTESDITEGKHNQENGNSNNTPPHTDDPNQQEEEE